MPLLSFSEQEIELLKETIQDILLSECPDKEEYTLTFVHKDGQRTTSPMSLNLGLAVELSKDLAKLIGLPDEQIKTEIPETLGNKFVSFDAHRLKRIFKLGGCGHRLRRR